MLEKWNIGQTAFRCLVLFKKNLLTALVDNLTQILLTKARQSSDLLAQS